MKKLLKLTSLCFVVLGLVSCGESTSSTGKTDNGSQTQEVTSDTKPTPTVSDHQNKTVSKIEVSRNPDKMEYAIGETFDPKGGEILATYSDSSTETISMSDSRVRLSNPNTRSTGKKNVKVTFEGVSVIFKITVTEQKYTITFDSDGGSSVDALSIEKGKTAAKPSDPTRSGYTFDGWFTDTDRTLEFDFDSEINASLTLYAKWLDSSKTIRSVTFDYGYYGSVPAKRILHVEDGSAVKKISIEPTRKGYAFTGWKTTEGKNYDFTATVNNDFTLEASWNLTNTGSQTYVFEAEDVDFTGIVGKGLSGTATGTSCIVTNKDYGASNDMYVSYLYQYGLGLTFQLTCDRDMSSVAFYARLSQFITDYTYTKDNWSVTVNGTVIDYPEIVFTDVPAKHDSTATPKQFADFSLGNVSLKKGQNTIKLTTTDTNAVEGTTMTAHAPLIDCIKFTASDFVMDWDATLGYPFTSNYTL